MVRGRDIYGDPQKDKAFKKQLDKRRTEFQEKQKKR